MAAFIKLLNFVQKAERLNLLSFTSLSKTSEVFRVLRENARKASDRSIGEQVCPPFQAL